VLTGQNVPKGQLFCTQMPHESDTSDINITRDSNELLQFIVFLNHYCNFFSNLAFIEVAGHLHGFNQMTQ